MSAPAWKWRLMNCSDAVQKWLESDGFASSVPVKENAVRTIWKSLAPDGKTYFIKLEKRGAFSCRDKADLEVRISESLRSRAGISCVSFSAFGTCGCWTGCRKSLLVSLAVQGAVSLKEYWFSIAAHDPEKRASVLANLRELLQKMQTAKLRHSDFHAGNVLVNTENGGMTLVDLAEIRFAGSSDTAELAHICTDLLPLLTDDEAERVIGGISGDPAPCWARAKSALTDLIAHEWRKREKQILSGNSKFSRTVCRDGHTYEIASDDCFRSRDLPDDLTTLKSATMPEDAALSAWLGMFRARLEGRSHAERYLLLERRGEKAVLYFEPENAVSVRK